MGLASEQFVRTQRQPNREQPRADGATARHPAERASHVFGGPAGDAGPNIQRAKRLDHKSELRNFAGRRAANQFLSVRQRLVRAILGVAGSNKF